MPATLVSSRFLEQLRTSRLLNESALARVREDFDWGDDADLANQLVEQKLLTEYHANHLLNGKHKGFHVGHQALKHKSK